MNSIVDNIRNLKSIEGIADAIQNLQQVCEIESMNQENEEDSSTLKAVSDKLDDILAEFKLDI